MHLVKKKKERVDRWLLLSECWLYKIEIASRGTYKFTTNISQSTKGELNEMYFMFYQKERTNFNVFTYIIVSITTNFLNDIIYEKQKHL